MSTPDETRNACELCGAAVGADQLEPLAGLAACGDCRTGDMEAAVRTLGYEIERRQFSPYSPMAGSSGEHVQVDIQRPYLGLELEVRFVRQRGSHGWFARLFNKTDPEIGIAEFDDHVLIEVEPEHEHGMSQLLQSPGARAAILWLVGHGCSANLVGRSMTVASVAWTKAGLPDVNDVARYTVALGIHLDRLARG
jgi:hypothetical protein